MGMGLLIGVVVAVLLVILALAFVTIRDRRSGAGQPLGWTRRKGGVLRRPTAGQQVELGDPRGTAKRSRFAALFLPVVGVLIRRRVSLFWFSLAAAPPELAFRCDDHRRCDNDDQTAENEEPR